MGVHQAAEQAAEVLQEPFWEGAIPFPGSVMSRFVAAFVADFDLKDSCSQCTVVEKLVAELSCQLPRRRKVWKI
jgi:hypothetical protein